ncbi:lipase family protein [Phormidesmis priestleyi ULC007]|uniref:Lipase family protein n=1 Tax=Phormidesmis priestleyi ULC007 TaxID=1920490 RepID=A0A2T1DKK1_9CYAN|nr:lipase family protein [Phormidesmis priestleyi]PSB20985.1 lipase family protein [Phormidesmis priestleyi ULC007]PZO53679.1 MAG: lipase family protein [Phormidesmis priestleyi]
MISTTLSLECRSLCASVAAYSIDPTGKFIPQEPYYSAVGFLTPPIAFAAGEDDIDACLVGTTDQGVVLAFRGTIPPDIHDQQSMLDWISDLTDNPIAAPGIPGKVHEGFWQGLSSLWEPMVKEIKQQMNAGGKSLPLYITGHSKGGAMSSLAALRLKIEEDINPAAVYTYAAAHPGDTTFANQYQLEIPNHIRYEYGNDIVPHIVPDAAFIDAIAHIPELGKFFKGLETWDYTHVGTLRFIDWNKKAIVGESSKLQMERLARLVGAIVEWQFEAIVTAHSASCGGGYMGGMCSSGVCV